MAVKISKAKSAVYFCVDMWSDMSRNHFIGTILITLGITGSFVHDSKIVNVALEFTQCHEDGVSMAEKFIKTLTTYNLLQKNFFITTDNSTFIL